LAVTQVAAAASVLVAALERPSVPAWIAFAVLTAGGALASFVALFARYRVHDDRSQLGVLVALNQVLHGGAAEQWLNRSNPDFDGRTPAELLRSGDYRRVLGAIEALAEGAFV
jgi:hypothetical protein